MSAQIILKYTTSMSVISTNKQSKLDAIDPVGFPAVLAVSETADGNSN